MIDMLIKQVILYNDKVEIYYNYTDKTKPDESDHQVLSFYTTTKSFVTDKHKIFPFFMYFTIYE